MGEEEWILQLEADKGLVSQREREEIIRPLGMNGMRDA
jgi:hypothetical protein